MLQNGSKLHFCNHIRKFVVFRQAGSRRLQLHEVVDAKVSELSLFGELLRPICFLKHLELYMDTLVYCFDRSGKERNNADTS